MKKVLLVLGAIALVASLVGNVVLLKHQNNIQSDAKSNIYIPSGYVDPKSYYSNENALVKYKNHGDTMILFKDGGTAIYPHFIDYEDEVMQHLVNNDTLRIECRFYSGNIHQKYSVDNWYIYFLVDWILVSDDSLCYKFIPDPNPYDGETCPF